jgi:HK97 family phage major capsid protein
MNPRAVAKLRATPKVSADAGAGFLMDSPNSMAGYPVVPTTAIATATNTTGVIFGAWSQLLIGYWSGLDILANPYESAAYSRGRVLIRAVRRGEAFAHANNLSV